MRKLVLLLLLLSLIPAAVHAAPPQGWPTVDQQIEKDKVSRGSELEKFVRKNQEFDLLRPEEAYDNIRVPIWLRVHWRKTHPGVEYSSTDPTGGYPLVLKEIYEWMVTHQDLKPGNPTHGKDGKALPPDYGKSLESSFEKASVGTNARISGAATNPRSESDIRVNYWDPTKIISGSNNIGGNGQQAMFFSTNTGGTWGQTFLPLATGDAFHSDPTVDWFSNGTAIATAIGINSSATQLRMRSYLSTNNGATWTLDGTFSGSQTNADKQIVWVDHSNTSAFKDNVYACWHNGLPQFVNRRAGSGGTWGTPLQISGAETTGTAIGCDVKTNSSGDVFVFWPATGNRRILMAKSTNGGVSYGTPVIVTTAFDSYDIGVPSFNNRRILIYATGGTYKTGTKDNVYVAWADLSGDTGCTTATNEPGSNASSTCKTRIWFSRSTNGGTTWSTPVKINNQAGLNDQYNPWMVVDETNGQLAIIYYDTVGDATRKKTHVYYQASFDDGSSWSTPLQVTTAQTDETIAGADLGNQYGDYNSLSGIAGTFFGSWTDRRSGGKEEIWTAAIQEGGTPCTPPAAPTGVSATASGANQINLSWSAVSGATEYRIFRATTSGGPYTQVGTSATTSFSDTGLTCNTTYYYVIRAFVGCESVNSAQVQATTASCPVCTTQTLYSAGFETPATGLAGFTTGTFLTGGSTVDWRGVQTCTAKTGTKIFRFGGSNCTANYGSGRFSFAQPNGASGIAVPAGSSTTRLSFWHRRRYESGYDGGTVTVSVNGTNYFFVPGTAILSGTYNGTTSASCPPAGGGGVPVFTGVSTSFTNTVVDLDAACNLATGGTGGCAGQSVRVGFTSITDCSVTDDGWFLDDVAVTACVP
ncbi:MAG TPA: hypothetical protein VLQ45_35315 [Thermoanaerobaculia bacterium]|nr:hypothetical protein [Thermoanaerobaculia bacterium]